MFWIIFSLFPIFVKSQFVEYSSPTYRIPNTVFYKGIPIYFKDNPFPDTQVTSNEEFEDDLDDIHEEGVSTYYNSDSGEYYEDEDDFPITYNKENSNVKETVSYENVELPLYKEHFTRYGLPHYYDYNPLNKIVVTSTVTASPTKGPGASFYFKHSKQSTTRPIYNTDYKVKLAKQEAKQSKNISKDGNSVIPSKKLSERKFFNIIPNFLPTKSVNSYKGLEAQGQPYPYSFGYKVTDYSGNSQFRNEVGEKSGAKRGSYGYVDAKGLKREVHYIADHKGFRAWIKTNEPGMTNSNPANVAIAAEKPTLLSQYSGKKPLYPVQASLPIPSYYPISPSYFSSRPLLTKTSLRKPLFSKPLIKKLPLLSKPLATRPLFSRPLFNRPLSTTSLINSPVLNWPVLPQPYGG